MSTGKQKVEFHIVHSTKGGCGKTTFALFKALDLAQKIEKEKYEAADSKSESGEKSASESDSSKSKKSDENPKQYIERIENAGVLYIDADFRGSALQWLLCSNSDNYSMEKKLTSGELIHDSKKEGKFTFSEAYRGATLNDFFLKTEKTLEGIIARSIFYWEQDDKNKDVFLLEPGLIGYLDFIFASPKNEDRQPFCYGKFGGHKENMPIRISEYVYHMRRLINKMLVCGKTSKDNELGQYRHIVIDMPPGDDEYSELLLEIIRESTQNNKNVTVNYYIVTTNDRGHLYTMRERIKAVQALTTNWKKFDTINLVLNCLAEGDFLLVDKDEAGNRVDLKENIEKELQKAEIRVQDLDHIIRIPMQKEYREFCRNRAMDSFGYAFNEILNKAKAVK